MTIRKLLVSAAVGLTLVAAPASATLIYQSTPDLNVNKTGYHTCATCLGRYLKTEPLDPFTLVSGATIGRLNLSAFNSLGYDALSPFTLEIYDNSHSTILFSRLITPTLVSHSGQDAIVDGTFGSFNLAAGSYWLGVIAPNYALSRYSGGNGGLIVTSPPHSGTLLFISDGNLGYQLFSASGVPEPATWAMMLMGFGLMGLGLRNRRKPTISVNCA